MEQRLADVKSSRAHMYLDAVVQSHSRAVPVPVSGNDGKRDSVECISSDVKGQN